MKNLKQGSEKSVEKQVQKLIAKKGFVICQNEYLRKIEEGEDLSDVPEVYLPNLEAEGVI